MLVVVNVPEVVRTSAVQYFFVTEVYPCLLLWGTFPLCAWARFPVAVPGPVLPSMTKITFAWSGNLFMERRVAWAGISYHVKTH